MNKLKITLLIILSLIVTSATFAYATIQYNLSTSTEHTVGVGNTIKVVDGLEVSLYEYENKTLTYFSIEPQENETHYLTYTYSYNIVASGAYNVTVSLTSDDIELYEVLVDSGYIYVTFSLNQEREYSNGDILNVGFQFDLVEISLNGFTQSSPLNMNDTTDTILYNTLDITPIEAYNIVKHQDYIDMEDLLLRNNIQNDLLDLYSMYIELGIIIFE